MIDVTNTWSVSDSEPRGKKARYFPLVERKIGRPTVVFDGWDMFHFVWLPIPRGSLLPGGGGVTLSRGEGLRH